MTRLRRSLLFVPGSTPERIAKAAASAADGVILDLEDAVAPAQKGQAREWVVAALRAVGFGSRERVVRINPMGTALGVADLAAVVPLGPDALLLPKVGSAEAVRAADAEVTRLERAEGRPVGAIRLHLLVETVAGLLAVRSLAGASPRVATLCYGAGDLARETRWRLEPGRRTELHAMSEVVLAARAAGVVALDSPCFDLGRPDRLEAHVRLGAEMGFDGIALIHPSQIEVAHRWYTPSAEAVADAERVLAAYQAAEAAGSGALTVDGQFVDAVHVEMARTTLERARQAAGR